MLITSTWEKKETFKMIPVTTNCPFNEVIYDPEKKFLAIVSKDKKENLKNVFRLDENGEPEFVSPKKPRHDQAPYKQQRVSLETYYEYYITKDEEVRAFVSAFAVNADQFDIEQFITAPVATQEVTAEVTA
jgi:hypothetical protein